MKTGHTQKPLKNASGFTLMELTMVILIFGMIMSVMFMALKFYYLQEVQEATEDALDISESAITEFRNLHGRYPCPADPTLGPGDANYGLEAQPCNMGIPYVQDVPGGRDTLTDADVNPDRVLIGAVPFNTLLLGPDGAPDTFDEINFTDLTDKLSTDGWGRKLTYAVTSSQTDNGTFNDSYGAIEVVDENDLDVLGDPASAHFVLVTHGENGRGAFMADGAAVDPCPPSLPVPPPIPPVVVSNINEIVNCNNLGKFLSGLRNEADHSYNDDQIKVVINESGSLWVPTSDNSINNTNTGFVGVGTPDPQEQLHIAGNLNANQLRAEKYCDVNGDDDSCIPGNLFADAYDEDGNGVQDMRCPAGEVAVGIDDNKLRCTAAFTGGAALTCAPGLYMIGISNVRGALCCNPVLPASNPNSCAGFVP